jgi:hypothetical protein
MSFAAINGDPCVTCIEMSRTVQKDPNASNNPFPVGCEITENVTCSDGCTYTITRRGVKWMTAYLITIYSLCTDYCSACVKTTVRKDEYTKVHTGDCEPNDKGPPRGGTYPHPPHPPGLGPGEEPTNIGCSSGVRT